MSEPLIPENDRSAEALARRFDDMAARIRLNEHNAFGGAFVIIPPENGGDPIETLILDTKQDPAQFFILLKTKAETQIQSLDALARNQQAFQSRR